MKNICCESRFSDGYVRPRWGRDFILTLSVGCTHGYPCCCPSDSDQNNALMGKYDKNFVT